MEENSVGEEFQGENSLCVVWRGIDHYVKKRKKNEKKDWREKEVLRETGKMHQSTRLESIRWGEVERKAKDGKKWDK